MFLSPSSPLQETRTEPVVCAYLFTLFDWTFHSYLRGNSANKTGLNDILHVVLPLRVHVHVYGHMKNTNEMKTYMQHQKWSHTHTPWEIAATCRFLGDCCVLIGRKYVLSRQAPLRGEKLAQKSADISTCQYLAEKLADFWSGRLRAVHTRKKVGRHSVKSRPTQCEKWADAIVARKVARVNAALEGARYWKTPFRRKIQATMSLSAAIKTGQLSVLKATASRQVVDSLES